MIKGMRTSSWRLRIPFFRTYMHRIRHQGSNDILSDNKKLPERAVRLFLIRLLYYFADFARVRMHLAHNVFWTGTPFSITVTRWRFGWNARFVVRCEKLLAWPKVVALPHTSHLAILFNSFRLFGQHCFSCKIFFSFPVGCPTKKYSTTFFFNVIILCIFGENFVILF